ncbi:fatty-acid amide hydrolase 2 [Anabrus simplex]|uniref:fatty-acid amide hydrolase 2 n=1 Tax=Anabrus simplex TaxID=316456 RepID=UPI0035A37FFE
MILDLITQLWLLMKRIILYFVTEILPSCTKWAIWFGMMMLRCIMMPFIRLRWLRPSRKLPPIENKVLMHSAICLAHMIRTKQITCEEVIKVYIRRVREVNPLLNAMVDDRFDTAMQEAKTVDRMVSQGRHTAEELAEKFPLLGVPLTVKGSIEVKGLSNACGQVRKVGERAAKDADSVRLMRDAGAIVLLVSNCPELCMSYETDNKVTGTTNNPYDLRRTPGGSSGGEAALLGAAASVIGLVSDIGGSSRIPAMFTGVFGHKPTPGLVSDVGHIPTATDKNWYRYFSVSLMARYSEDLCPVLKILSHKNARSLRFDEEMKVRDLKVFYMEDDGGSILTNKVHSEIRQAMRKVLSHLKVSHQINPQKIQIKDFKNAIELSLSTLLSLQGVTSIFQKDSDPTEWKSVCLEVLKYFVCLSSSNFPPILYGVGKKIIDRIPESQMREIANKINSIQKQLKTLLGDDGVFLYPTFTDPAGFHMEMYFKFFNSVYSAVFNTLELPATNCPVGLTKNGLPISIQIIAAPYQDRLSILLAQELEVAFGGWVPPPEIHREGTFVEHS